MKKNKAKFGMVVTLMVIVCQPLTGFSQSTNSFFQFVNAQAERRYTNVPHEVLALWYGWFGPGISSWERTNADNKLYDITAHHPSEGYYDSHDIAAIDRQIDEAKAHGITCFVASWFGKASQWHDKSVALLLQRAEKKNFKVSIYWEVERDTGSCLVQFAVDDLTYILEGYARSKAFLKVDGKPVIFVYDRVEGQTPLATLFEIIKKTRQQAGDFLLVGHGYQDSLAFVFDGLHTEYANMHLDLLADSSPDKLNQYCELASESFQQGAKIGRQHSRIVCPMIIPGFDNTKSSPANFKAERYDGRTYRGMWEAALNSKPDWVLISSWNEWAEGTEVEPSRELGDEYLKITAEYAKPFLGSPPVAAPPPTTNLPQFCPGTTNEISDILAGRTVAMLHTDGFYDPEFWADYLGATVQRINWDDLIDSTNFNVRNFPVLIVGGHENYTSSVRVTDDVTRSLVRYLHEGGFFVSLPTGAWPFHYDDARKGEPPICITDNLGLGVDNGFDDPPAGTDLKFFVNKSVLRGLPPIADFPTSGDLRFRPANPERVSRSDYCLPLVQLWGAQHQFYGDAAAYIDHRSAPLWPGKSVYVWMRTAECLGPNEFYPSLYYFISTKLNRQSHSP